MIVILFGVTALRHLQHVKAKLDSDVRVMVHVMQDQWTVQASRILDPNP